MANMDMKDVEPIDIQPTDAKAATDSPETGAADPQSGDGEPEPTNFMEAFKSAQSGEDAAEKTPETPETPEAPEVPEAEPAVKESRSAKDFKVIKDERDNYRRELESARQELTSAKAADQSTVLAQLKTERDDLSTRLKAASLERHPDFQNYYQSKIDSVLAQIKSAAGDENGEQAAQIATMPDSEWRTASMEEIFANLPASQQARMGALLTRVDELNAEKATQLQQAEAAYEQMNSQQDAQRAETIKASESVMSDAVTEARALEVFQMREGDDDWNTGVNARLETANNVFLGENDEPALARASLWAAAAPKYRELLGAQIEVNRRLQAQLKELQGATPSVDAETASSTPAEEKDFITTFMEAQGLQQQQ